MEKSRTVALGAVMLDLFLLVASFAGVHFVKYGDLQVSAIHRDILFILVVIWMCVALLYNHFRVVLEQRSVHQGLSVITRRNVLIASLLSLSIVAFQLIGTSRIQAYGTCLVYYALEVLSYSLYRYAVDKQEFLKIEAAAESQAGNSNRSLALTVVDGICLLTAFAIATWLKRGEVVLSDDNVDVIIILYGLWVLSFLITGKFERANFSSYYGAIAPCFKAILLMAAGLAVIIFAVRLFYLSRLQIFGTLPLFLGLEMVSFYVYYSYRSHGGHIQDIESIHQVHEMLGKEQRDLPATDTPVVQEPAEEKLHNALDFLNPALSSFIRDSIDLTKIDRSECAIIHADNQTAAGITDRKQYRLIVNINKLNDIRWINQYLLVMHSFLQRDGFIVGIAQTTDARMGLFLKRFPKYVAKVLYLIDFVWRRIFPKLPYTKKIYFALTKGRNRLISRAEILGRLYFCGFRSVAESEDGDRYYFSAQKVRTPSLSTNPTYGPLVLLSRIGAFNQPITVYKFRTMHPYSEYLQDYIYERNLLDKGGKFKSDFRVTEWGKFMRKWWIDELPMLYNWLKGDLQLVGVRPLSNQYLSLYTDELRELRRKVKPGLIPPFYADLPSTLEEIVESEKRYIQAYLTNPLKTQWRYFIKCFLNIAVRRARSA